MNEQFVAIARDPRIIHRVHHYCDEYCDAGARNDDALGCAKLAIVSIERSRAALRTFGRTAGADEVDPLIAMLDELDRGLQQHFPDARAFVRPGLDCAVA